MTHPAGTAVSGRYAIDIGGVPAGWVMSVEGGHATSDVVTEKLGVELLQGKPSAPLSFDRIKITCGTGMTRAFYQWIKDTLDFKIHRESATLSAARSDQKDSVRVTLHDALLTEIGFPACDGAAKDAAFLRLTLAPKSAEIAAAGPPASHGAPPGVEKQWLPQNFRLRIDGLEEPCSHVNKIEALTVKQKVVEHAAASDYQKEGAGIEVPNLVITLPESHADEFRAWQQAGSKKGGALDYLATDGSVLFTLHFGALGVASFTPDKVEAGGENIRRLKFEMYCEEIKFDYKGAWA